MAHHHHDVQVEASPRDTTMLRMANALPQLVGLGRDGNKTPPQLRPQDLELLGMDQAGLDDLRDFTLASQEAIQAFFDAIL